VFFTYRTQTYDVWADGAAYWVSELSNGRGARVDCAARSQRKRRPAFFGSTNTQNENDVSTINGGGSSPPEGPLHAVLAFYRLSRGLKSADALRDLGWERLSTLSVVARREPVSISELSAAEAVTAPTISRTVAALQDQALVRCVANRDDGRSVLVTSTAKGRATLQKGMARTLQQIAEMLGRLDAAELEAMADVIKQARAAKTSR
jgi:DNA-binding MarR family transcriptional regulator